MKNEMDKLKATKEKFDSEKNSIESRLKSL